MNLSFDDVEQLQSLSNLNFEANSPISVVLLTLASAPTSLSVDDIISTTGLEKPSVNDAIRKLYKGGIIYTEQKDHYTVTHYGQQMAQHIQANPTATAHKFALTTDTLRQVLMMFNPNGDPLIPAQLDTITTNPQLNGALQDLVNRGYVRYVETQTTQSYGLSPLGASYFKHHLMGRNTITKGMKPEAAEKLPLEDLIVEVYQRFKTRHPEYKNIYDRWESGSTFMTTLKKDVRRFLIHELPIASPPFGSATGAQNIAKYFGSESIPYISSIEDAISRLVHYFQTQITAKTGQTTNTFGHVLTMDEIKETWGFIRALEEMSADTINKAVSKFPAGTILTQDQLIKLAEKLLKTKYPHIEYEKSENFKLKDIELKHFLPRVSQAIQSKINLDLPVIFPNETTKRLIPILGEVLDAPNIKLFNDIVNSDDIDAGVVREALANIFTTGKAFTNKDWSGIKLIKQGITGIDFTGTKFDGGDCSNTMFSGCVLTEVSFVRTNLEGTKFENCTLTDTDFQGAEDIESTQFMGNTGKAKNLPIIHKTKTNKSELGSEGRIAKEVKKPTNPQTFFHSDLNKYELQLAPKLLAILQGKPLEPPIGSIRPLKFQAFGALAPEQIQDLKDFLTTGEPAAWITLDALKQMVANPETKAELAQAGITQTHFNKMMGIIGRRNKPTVEKVKEKTLEELEKEKVQSNIDSVLAKVQQAYQPGVTKMSELAALFNTPELKDIADIFAKSKSEKDAIAELQKYLQSADASPKITAMREKERLFSYTARLSTIDRTDRARMSDSPYQDKMFAILLSPNANGVQNPDVRTLVEGVKNAKFYSHWRDAIASARIEPHLFTVSEGGEMKTKRVWIIAELQADPMQKYTFDGLKQIYPSINTDIHTSVAFNSPEESVARQVVEKGSVSLDDLKPVVETMLNTILNTLLNSNVIAKFPESDAYFKYRKDLPQDSLYYVGMAVQNACRVNGYSTKEELYPVAFKAFIENIIDNKLAKKRGNNLVPTTESPKILRAYAACEGLRYTFKRWPQAIILETINRAVQMGDVDEVWVASAADFAKNKKDQGDPWNLDDVYDKAAKKFTKKLERPKVAVNGQASKVFDDAPFRGDGGAYMAYWVIDVNQWKGGASTASLVGLSALKLMASMYTDAVDAYVDAITTQYSYLRGGGHTDPILIESACAYILAQNKIHPDNEDRFIEEINEHYHLNIVRPPVPYARLIVRLLDKLDSTLVRVVKQTGEEPLRLLQDVLESVTTKYMANYSLEQQETYKNAVTQIVTNDVEELLPDSYFAYSEIQQTGYNTNPEGEELVGTNGEPLEPQGDEPSIDEESIKSTPKELSPIKFDKPTHREYENLKQEQLDKLLDAYNAETDPAKKEILRRKLHEISTLANLKFADLVGDSLKPNPDDIVATLPSGRVIHFNFNAMTMWLENHEHLTQERPAQIKRDTINGALTWGVKPYWLDEYVWMEPDKSRKDKEEMPIFENAYQEYIRRDVTSSIVSESVIVHEDGKWKVKTHDKSRTLGEHATEESAKKQLQAIEISKHKSGGLNFAAVDKEFTQPKDTPYELDRNDMFQYEPAHGNGSPVEGGPVGGGGASDTTNMDMKGGFYTDLNLPDMARKQKEQVSFEPSRNNLQLWTSLKFSDIPEQNRRVTEKGTTNVGYIVGPGNSSDTWLVQWDGQEKPVNVRKLYLQDATNVGGFNMMPPGTTIKPKDRPRPIDTNYNRGLVSFEYTQFKSKVLSSVISMSKYANLSPEAFDKTLYKEFLLAKRNGLV